MEDHAKKAVIDAKAAHGIDLDYTPESIQQVEHILSVYGSKTRGPLSWLLGRALSADDAARLARMYGSYIGESLRRKWGGEWLRDHPVAGAGSYPIACQRLAQSAGDLPNRPNWSRTEIQMV